MTEQPTGELEDLVPPNSNRQYFHTLDAGQLISSLSVVDVLLCSI